MKHYSSPTLSTFGTVSDITCGPPGFRNADIGFLPQGSVTLGQGSTDNCIASVEDLEKGIYYPLGSEECKALGF